MIVRKAELRDALELEQLFHNTMEDVVTREELQNHVFIEDEVTRLMSVFEASLARTSTTTTLLVAIKNNSVVGTISLTNPGQIITNHVPEGSKARMVGTAYVHVDYQRQGVGKVLFTNILKVARTQNAEHVYLDAGFRSSRAYWQRMLGQPTIILPNFWSKGADHHIWSLDPLLKTTDLEVHRDKSNPI
ncbi:GNAT family N-acetyltransferase [Paenalkalicoccus suaedae]|uniref:GNAT family N-acetyltransferase n=1 Tax=Paenalkalicoccus suaedae TaxID=2592382 RepID=A0A859F9U4_9BACI|nr:GNAT family N-acetyltransferase [Paenalkalicoccus suaedae]QKS69909.1 GNAT family N-acetyltransferase [Paenalkalicoccus suaedae]